MTLTQQAAGYIDKARSLEASARQIDALRRDLSAAIAAGNDLDASIIKSVGKKYSKILEEYPVNHTSLDYRWRSPGVASSLMVHARAGALSIVVTALVVAYPFL